jgi:hypothetical protein
VAGADNGDACGELGFVLLWWVFELRVQADVVEWGRGEVGGRGYKKRRGSQVGQQKLFTSSGSGSRGQAPMGRRFHRYGAACIIAAIGRADFT